MILHNDAALVMVFRGTRLQSHSLYDVLEVVLIDEDDLWTDSQFLPSVCRAGRACAPGIRRSLRGDQRPTGRGGAHAATEPETVVDRAQPGRSPGDTGCGAASSVAQVEGIYTYGSPRVGDTAFVSVLPPQSHYRFVHRDDWVPTVPPELLGYVHGGILRPLCGSGERRFWDDVTSGTDLLVAAVKSMASQVRIDMGRLPFKISGLTDHAAIYYATLLWNELIASCCPPRTGRKQGGGYGWMKQTNRRQQHWCEREIPRRSRPLQ